jgi:hypothetical protein
MATHATDIADLTNSVVADYGRNFLVDIASDLRSFPACEKLMQKKRMVEFSGSGDQIKWPLLYEGDSNTRAVGFYDVDNLDQTNATVYATLPWRHITTGNHYDVKELSINSSPAKIFSFTKAKQKQMWLTWFKEMEGYFWGGPASSSDDTTPYGLTKYWLDHNSSAGFNGGNNTNWSDGPAGIDCSDSNYSNWSHYTAQHSVVSMEDAVQKMIRACKETGFRGIPNKMMEDYSRSGEYDLGIYTVMDNEDELEAIARSLDDKIGSDLAKYYGQVMIKRTPVEEVPWLSKNRNTSKPFIGLDWGVVRTLYPKGEYMRHTPYHRDPNAHEVRQEFNDASRQFAILNRRRIWTVAKAAYISS